MHASTRSRTSLPRDSPLTDKERDAGQHSKYSLRVLRRILNLAMEWGVLTTAPKVEVLSGERRREHVISREEEARYLAAAPEPPASVATMLVDTGMRPEKCFRLRWENITWHSSRNGA